MSQSAARLEFLTVSVYQQTKLTLSEPRTSTRDTTKHFSFSINGRDAPQINKRDSAILIATVFVFVTARFWHLTSYGLFGDEVFTLWTAAQNWKSLIASVVGDVVHPPLFYALLKVWIELGGQSLLWLKLLPALLSIASIVPFILLCRELRLEPATTCLALSLMAVNGFLIDHAQELRMYSLVVLLTLSSLWLFSRLINIDGAARNIQAALFAVNLLLVFSHYYGWVVVALEFSYLLMWQRERVKAFAIDMAVLVVCLTPWVYAVAKAARDNPSRVDFTWNRPPAASEIVGYYANLSGPLSYRLKVVGPAFVLSVFLTPIIAWGRRVLGANRESEKPAAFWWLVLFAFAPVALAFVASHLLPQPVWAFRYLIVAAPAYFLIVAAAASRLKRKPVRTVAISLILGWSCVSGFTQMIERDKIAWEPLVQSMIKAEAEPRAVRLYVTDSNIGNTIQFYLDQAGETRFQISSTGSWDSLDDDRFWVALIRYKHETGPLLQDGLRGRGYTVGDSIESEAAGHRAVMFPVGKR